MERVFAMSKYNVVIWILNGCVCLGSVIAFLMIDGKELVYSLYIPLDVLLNLCKVGFYFYYYWIDLTEKANAEKLVKAIDKKHEKRQ